MASVDVCCGCGIEIPVSLTEPNGIYSTIVLRDRCSKLGCQGRLFLRLILFLVDNHPLCGFFSVSVLICYKKAQSAL